MTALGGTRTHVSDSLGEHCIYILLEEGPTCTLTIMLMYPCVVPPQTVCKLLSQFPDQFYSQLLEWLSRLARNIKVLLMRVHNYIGQQIYMEVTASVKYTGVPVEANIFSMEESDRMTLLTA